MNCELLFRGWITFLFTAHSTAKFLFMTPIKLAKTISSWAQIRKDDWCMDKEGAKANLRNKLKLQRWFKISICRSYSSVIYEVSLLRAALELLLWILCYKFTRLLELNDRHCGTHSRFSFMTCKITNLSPV